MIVLNENHARRILEPYLAYYHETRAHLVPPPTPRLSLPEQRIRPTRQLRTTPCQKCADTKNPEALAPGPHR